MQLSADAPVRTDGKIELVGLTKDELKAAVASIGLPGFRAKQIWNWVYCRGAKDFSDMSNIAKSTQAELDKYFTVSRPRITQDLISEDGTRKWLIAFADGNEVEMVFIPTEDRGTLCISSQVGCTLTCSFCHTGTQMWVRNLTSAEIVAQVMLARDALDEWPAAAAGRTLTNIVFMGMGEPLFNYDHVAKAIKIIMDGEGLTMSRRRITISTSGVVPLIRKMGEELGVNLAISLHASRDELRNQLVPLNKKYPLKELISVCHEYNAMDKTRRILFEYVMLKGVNDSDQDAQEMINIFKGLPAKVNLIPFNDWPGSDYECSSNNRTHAFADMLVAAGHACQIREPRGRDILAACGQLKSESERKKKSKCGGKC